MLEKAQLIEAHEPRWESSWMWLVLLTVYFTVQGVLVWTLQEGSWWLTVPLVLLLGHLMHDHLLAFHEASHGTLCPNRWLNDSFGLFIGFHAFMSLSLYRAAHHYHHAYLASERDDELWPFVIPTMPRWFRCLAALIELTLGLVFTPLIFLRSFLRRETPVQNPAVRRRVWAELLLMALVWSVVLAATAWFDGWRYLLVLYLLPALLAGNVQSLRKYVEHMGLTGSTVLGMTRSVVPSSSFGRMVISSMFKISYHGVHHTFAQMPQGSMPHFTSVLTPSSPDELPPFPTYLEAFWDMAVGLRDPRVGAQWLDAKAGQPCRKRVRIGLLDHTSLKVERAAMIASDSAGA